MSENWKKLQKKDFEKMSKDELQDLIESYDEVIGLEESGEGDIPSKKHSDELATIYWDFLQKYYQNPKILDISFDDAGTPDASNLAEDCDLALAMQDADPDDFGYVPMLERDD